MIEVWRTIARRPLSCCTLPLALCALLAACASVPAPETPAAVAARAQQAIASPIRTEQDRRMDATRKPQELLTFTQVAPGMMVLDVAAGGGYTSQLLVLAVGASGKVWAQRPEAGAALTKRLADQPQGNFIPVYRPFDDPVPPEAPKLDLVTLILNYHDISYLPVDRAKMNERIFAALKSGGRYVVVDHAAVAGSGITAGRTLHRIDESVVIAEARKAGFVLDAEGSFLRNPDDPRTATTNSSPIATDKFALRFVKP
jgi:predicted methyltransferase